MASRIEVCNQALSHIGDDLEIATLTEASTEARACNRWYNQCRQDLIRGFSWPFARKTVTLGLVTDFTATPAQSNGVPFEWLFSYRYPSDCLRFIRIQSLRGVLFETRQSRVDFQIGADNAGRLIYANWPNANGEYIFDVTNEGFWTSDFALAMTYALAWNILPKLTRGDPTQLRATIKQGYADAITMAMANAGNEAQEHALPPSEFERTRTGDNYSLQGNSWSALPVGFTVE